jgi:hypothetical protein
MFTRLRRVATVVPAASALAASGDKARFGGARPLPESLEPRHLTDLSTEIRTTGDESAQYEIHICGVTRTYSYDTCGCCVETRKFPRPDKSLEIALPVR